MEWQDTGILLYHQELGEQKRLATFFTRTHGLQKGACRITRKNPLQVGDICHLRWQARLATQTGQFYLERDALQKNKALALAQREALHLQQYIFSLLRTLLPQGHAYPPLYEETVNLFSNDSINLVQLFSWELSLLEELGYGLQLKRCALTNSTEDLCFISPNTGHAASGEAGKPYAEKLLPYPKLLHGAPPTEENIKEALAITAFFLKKFLATSPNTQQAFTYRELTIERVIAYQSPLVSS